MTAKQQFEMVSSKLASLRRNELKHEIMHFEGRFPMDFTEKYLDTLPTDKLRHILLAAKMIH